MALSAQQTTTRVGRSRVRRTIRRATTALREPGPSEAAISATGHCRRMTRLLTWSFAGRRETPHLDLAVDTTFASVDAALAALERCRDELRAEGAVTAVLLDRTTSVGEFNV